MGKANQQLGMWIVLAAIVAVGANWYLTQGPGSALAVTGDLQAQILEHGTCPDDATSDICVATKNTVAEPDSASATSAAVYTEGKTTAASTINTLTNADVCANNSVNCKNGETYRLIIGDGSTYYHRYGDEADTGSWKVATKAIVRYDVPVYSIGSATLTVTNTTAFNQGTVGVTLGSGEDNGEVSIRVKEGTADAYFGTPGQTHDIVVCFNYSTANFTSVELTGSGVTPNVGLTSQVSGYERCDGYSGSTDLVDFGYYDIPIFIDTIAGVNPGDTGGFETNITIAVLDFATWVKDGEIRYGVENSDTLAAIGATDISTYGAVGIW